MFSNLSYCALLNAHILYSKQHSSPKTFLEFMPPVGSDLLEGRKKAATRGNNQMNEITTELFSCPRKIQQIERSGIQKGIAKVAPRLIEDGEGQRESAQGVMLVFALTVCQLT